MVDDTTSVTLVKFESVQTFVRSSLLTELTELVEESPYFFAVQYLKKVVCLQNILIATCKY